MEFIRNESFDDLIVNPSSANEDHVDLNEPSLDGVIPVQKQDAHSFDLGRLMVALERRSLPIKGFYSDDVKTLQAAFDKEHEEHLKAKRKVASESKITLAREAAEQKRKDLIAAFNAEEEAAISQKNRVAAWFEMIHDGISPVQCRIDELTDITARSLAKLLFCDTRLVSVDVSNMRLSDQSGAYLGRSLLQNTTLQRLEMGNNQFAAQTCLQFARSLLINRETALNFLSLESNPLSSGDDSEESITLFAKAISENKSLVTLSLWRCGLRIKDGRLLANAITKGDSKLVSLEVGYNHFDSLDVDTIVKKLESNRQNRATNASAEAERILEQCKRNERKAKAEAAAEKETAKAKWLSEEEKARAEVRRRAAEERLLEHEKEIQNQKAAEHAQKMESARTQQLNKKKSKIKGKGKKK